MTIKLVDKKTWYRLLWGKLQTSDEVRAAAVLGGPYLGARIFWDGQNAVCSREAPEEFWKQDCFSNPEAMAPGQHNGDTDRVPLFVEILSRRPRLVVLGGGHISLPVCAMGKMLDFHVTVMDDRPEFASKDRFPHADQVICDDFSHLSSRIPDLPNTYYVIVTRGHLADEVCAQQILERRCAYVGMIGSKKKVAAAREKLEKAGIERKCLDDLHAPIGLKIGAQTPSEIAVSIMAEIIQVKNRVSSCVLDPEIGAWLEEEGGKAVMAEILDKKGSAPRGPGSRMAVLADGRCLGSVGGGLAEYETVQEAKQLAYSRIKEFRMDGRESASSGMICGGIITVLLEPL